MCMALPRSLFSSPPPPPPPPPDFPDPSAWSRETAYRRASARFEHASRGYAARQAKQDDGFDAVGMAVAAATGIPIGPNGITPGAVLGAAMHVSADPAPAPTREPSSSSYSDSSSSYSSDSSSSSSYDSGSSSSSFSSD